MLIWEDNVEISLGEFHLEIFLVFLYQVDGGQVGALGGFEAKIGQSCLGVTKNEFPCWSASEWTNDPAFWEPEGDDDEDKVEDHHDPAHHLRHLPLEDDDGDEDEEEHDEEHPDGAADANAVHLHKKGTR